MDHEDHDGAKHSGPLGWYHRTPLYVRIMIALIIGAIVGKLMGPKAAKFKPFSDIVLQLLRLLATPLIFVAVVHALMKAHATGKTAGKLAWFLMSNTVVAILVGLLVANTLRPGNWAPFTSGGQPPKALPFDAGAEFLSKIPSNFVEPFRSNEILSIIVVAISFGIAMRIVRARQKIAGQTGFHIVEDLMETIFQVVMVMLQWIFHIVPLASATRSSWSSCRSSPASERRGFRRRGWSRCSRYSRRYTCRRNTSRCCSHWTGSWIVAERQST
jgi:Na+/H+-dicarboxylate symporter